MARPPLDPAFRRNGVGNSVKLLRPDKLDRPPHRRIAAEGAAVVLVNALFEWPPGDPV